MAAGPVTVPGMESAVGSSVAATAVLRTKSLVESGQHAISKITAQTIAVNANHSTSPASRLPPMIGAALVAMISPPRSIPPSRNAGPIVKFHQDGAAGFTFDVGKT